MVKTGRSSSLGAAFLQLQSDSFARRKTFPHKGLGFLFVKRIWDPVQDFVYWGRGR